MLFNKKDLKFDKTVESNSLNILVNTKEKQLASISRYPVIFFDTEGTPILIEKSGSYFSVNNQKFVLNDLKLGHLILKLKNEFSINVSIVHDKILCELPSILLQDFVNYTTTIVDVNTSPMNLNQISRLNSTILEAETTGVETFKVVSPELEDVSFEKVGNQLYTKLNLNFLPNKLIVKSISTCFYSYLVKDFVKIDEGYLTNFGDIV